MGWCCRRIEWVTIRYLSGDYLVLSGVIFLPFRKEPRVSI